MNLTERQLENGGYLISLEGEADLAAAPEFQASVRKVIGLSVPFLIVDFSQTTFVNTPIWAVLVEYYQHANANGSKLAVTGLEDRVLDSFNVVQFGEFISHYPSVEEALAVVS